MGEKICKTKKYLGSPKLTPLQLIWVVFGIFFFIFMETSIFREFNDVTKVIVYASFMVICVLLGVSIINVKKIASDMKAIYTNKNMTLTEKVNAYGNLALTVLSMLGEAWDLLNQEQFKSDEPTEEINDEVTENLTKQE